MFHMCTLSQHNVNVFHVVQSHNKMKKQHDQCRDRFKQCGRSFLSNKTTDGELRFLTVEKRITEELTAFFLSWSHGLWSKKEEHEDGNSLVCIMLIRKIFSHMFFYQFSATNSSHEGREISEQLKLQKNRNPTNRLTGHWSNWSNWTWVILCKSRVKIPFSLWTLCSPLSCKHNYIVWNEHELVLLESRLEQAEQR